MYFLRNYVSSDVDIGFESGDSGAFRLGVEDESPPDYGSSLDKYIECDVGVDNGYSLGWGFI